MSNTTRQTHLIESDNFPIEFLSAIAERESWRKEIYRPIYHIHKWWAKRLGSVFRGILLGCLLPEDTDFETAFYQKHDFSGVSVFDPFMGSGVTVGEAHKLGCISLGRDINTRCPLDASEALQEALPRAEQKLARLASIGLTLSQNDCRVALYSQFMAALGPAASPQAAAQALLAQQQKLEETIARLANPAEASQKTTLGPLQPQQLMFSFEGASEEKRPEN